MENSIKKQITIRINEKLLDRIKDIVYWNPGYTLTNFIEISLDAAVDGLQHYPCRTEENLKSGRKIKSIESNIFSFLKDKLNIEDVIRNYLPLEPCKKDGYLKGKCPFIECIESDETKFIINPSKGIYYCDSCKNGGDMISFVSKIENVSQIDAAIIIRNRHKL